MLDKVTMRSRGFGFVTFSDPSSLDNVLNDTHVIDGRPVEVKRAISKEEMETGFSTIDNYDRPPVSRTKKIFVGGLSHTTSDDLFRKYFEDLGTVVIESQVMIDHDSGRHRGFGFVTFDNEDTVDHIMQQQHEIDGKPVEIKRAEPKRQVRIGRNFQPMSPSGGGVVRGGMGRSWGRIGGNMGMGGAFVYSGGGGFNRPAVPYYGGGVTNNSPMGNAMQMGYSDVASDEYRKGYGGMAGGNWPSMYSAPMGMMGGGYSAYGQPPPSYGGFGLGDNGSMPGRTFQRSGRAYHPYRTQPQ